MKQFLLGLLCLSFFQLNAQVDSVVIPQKEQDEVPATKLFYAQKVVNSKTVEVLRKGVLEFNVSHNFGDIAGDAGGASRFFGLDGATDIKIGFQTGLSDRFNLILSRTKGAGLVQQLWEIGIKWQLMSQVANDPKHPISLTIFANDAMSTMKRVIVPDLESSFEDFASRHSQVVQVMIAKKLGSVSLQISPLWLHTNYVEPNDQENIIALGAAMRLPLSKKFVIVADWFHSFHSDSAENFYKNLGMEFRDPIGIGLEILTEGHVFHLNFTNATELLENRFIRRTVTSWGDGQFRWSFTIARNFILFRPKK